MRRLMVFNPEHDLALANGDKHFIAPANIRQMAHDLAPLLELIDCDHLVVWGWDSAVKSQLLRLGVAEAGLPTESALKALRTCSARQCAHHLLRAFRAEHPNAPYIGESILAHHTDEIVAYTEQHGHILLKDPLSSSGKGLRHVKIHQKSHQEPHPTPPLKGGNSDLAERQVLPCREDLGGSISSWANALIRRHGYLTAEPYYNKVQDFAMEFYIRDRQCHFIGYSLFTTNSHGRYEGNILMTDEKIEAHLSQYVPQASLHEVRDWFISHYEHIIPAEWDTTLHPLHFGIDMMVISLGQEFKLHPCVEINLRMNMGIIAHEVRRRLLAPGTEGSFHVTSFSTEEAAQSFHREQTTQHPATYSKGLIISGYHPLTPILPYTRHHAYVLCQPHDELRDELR